MKVIVVTGCVGTGKTTVAKRIAKEHAYTYVDVNALIKREKIHDGYDRSSHSYLVDPKKLNKRLISLIASKKEDGLKGLVLDSHLSHYLPKRYVDQCIVTQCDLKQLHRRLLKRGYGKSKIRENLDAAIFDVCLIEAKEAGHNVKVIKT